MRTLVIQLARFGDIYQSWPAWRALKRANPEGELHVLVRERFRAAADMFPGITVHALPTREILEPIAESEDVEASHARLTEFFAPLMAMNFDRIVNLTFSPVSSYITDWIAGPDTVVSGYTRHADGHFHAPDDVSAYFHAQAGVGRANRFHVTELFASVAGVDLIAEDFSMVASTSERSGIIVHLAASAAEKTYPAELWIEVLREIAKSTREKISIIGSGEERSLGEAVCSQIPSIINRAGETTLDQLFPLIAQAKLLIGADSAPIHIAALTGTRVLNLSCMQVNFWETGPLSAGSRVLFATEMANHSPHRIANEVLAMIGDREPAGPCFVRPSELETYQPHEIGTEKFSWNLIQALYTGTPYPPAETLADRLAFQRLFEISELALQQLAQWENSSARPTAARILAQIDVMLAEISRLNPRIDPLIQWFETERLRIPPGDQGSTFERTRKCYQDLFLVCSVYRDPGDSEAKVRARAAALCEECAPQIREHNLHVVNDSFQTLLSALHELARHSTKVADQSWSSVLDEVNSALERRDFVELADLLQWKLGPALNPPPRGETFGQDMIS